LAATFGDDPDEDHDPLGPTFSRKKRKAGNGPSPGGAGESDDVDADEGDPETVRPGRPRRATGAETAGEALPDGPLPVGWLVVVDGPGVGHVVTLLTGTMTIGRGGKSTAKLDLGDPGISREDHARLDYDTDTRTFHIMPGRGPETRLDGKKVLSPEKLTRGALVKLGATTLRFAPFCDATFDWTVDG